MSDLTTPPDAQPVEPAWKGLCAALNRLRHEKGSWWRKMAEDGESVPRVDASSVTVRIRGNVLAEIGTRQGAPQCRVEPGHLLLAHPGARTVLGDAASEVRSVRNLDDLSEHYEHVRRRACRHVDRRQATLDRLFLRHPCVLAVDAPLPAGSVDFVALSPGGTAVFFLLRRYADGDLRLKGRGGIAWRLAALDGWLADAQASASWVRGLLESCGALDTRHARRYREPDSIRVHGRARLLIVDFDHAQRLEGLPGLRTDLKAALDRTLSKDDIPCIGDPGNISYATLFSGL